MTIGFSPQEGLLWRHQDHLGSLRVKTDSTGAVKCRHWYYPYGELGSSTCSEKDARKFTDKERDPESGLDFFGARYYASTHGRFTSVDPSMESGRPEAPQTWNRYTYALGNPEKFVDPNGESATLAGALIGGAIGGAVAWYQGRDLVNGIASGAVAGAIAGSVIDTGGASLGVLAVAGAAGGAAGGIVHDGPEKGPRLFSALLAVVDNLRDHRHASHARPQWKRRRCHSSEQTPI